MKAFFSNGVETRTPLERPFADRPLLRLDHSQDLVAARAVRCRHVARQHRRILSRRHIRRSRHPNFSSIRSCAVASDSASATHQKTERRRRPAARCGRSFRSSLRTACATWIATRSPGPRSRVRIDVDVRDPDRRGSAGDKPCPCSRRWGFAPVSLMRRRSPCRPQPSSLTQAPSSRPRVAQCGVNGELGSGET